MATAALGDPSPALARLPTQVFEGHTTGAVHLVAYFHDGKRIISASDDKTVRIWDVESQKQEDGSLVHDFEVTSIALSPDEQRLVSGGEGVVLWDLEGRTVMWKKEAGEVDGYRVAYSPGGLLVAARQGDAVIVLNAETGERARDPLHFGGGEYVWSLAFSPDGSRLAAGSDSGNVRVFDVATGESIVGSTEAHKKPVTSLIYDTFGGQFVTASGDKSIRVWSAAARHEIGSPMLGHEDWIRQIALSRDGQRLASGSSDRTVRVWDFKTRWQIGGPLEAQGVHHFLSVAWSPDGRSIAAAGSGDKIYLWDAPIR